jgi:hypothetical protein
MDTPWATPGPATVRCLATALATVDRDAVPPGPLARELHLAVTELARLGAGEPSNARLAELLAPLYRVLDALGGNLAEDRAPRALMELVVRVDDATALLEAPDLAVVPTDQLAGRFRELYGGIVRLRGASALLHRAWRSALATGTEGR